MSAYAIRTLATALSLLSLLAACGGGGGSNGGPSSSSDTPTTPVTPVTPPALPALAANASVSGVAATGAPLLGASIKLVDANGAAVPLVDAAGNPLDSATTSMSDGSYRLQLGRSATLPLLMQLVGRDVAGNPVVLHSRIASNSAPVVANLTPATSAVVAMVLGANPLSVFQNAAANASNIATLSSATAIAAASDQVKTIIANNLKDGKIANSTGLDLFQDASFAANKSGVDAALEGLTIRFLKDATNKDQLLLKNKFVAPGAEAIKVDLATAKTELGRTTGGSVARAVTSTTKTTTSSASTVANLATLDSLAVAVNTIIAQGGTPDFSPLLGSYTMQSGLDQATITATLTNYAARNYQLSRFQVTGCADATIATAGCARLLVSATVTNSSGQVVDIFSDAAGFSRTGTPNWTFVGNNVFNDFAVYPAAVATYGLDGVLANGLSPNPNSGVQVLVTSLPSDPQKGIGRLVQTPGGYIIPFAECGLNTQCVATDPAVTPVATGELKDTLLDQATVSWIGNRDGIGGARYSVSFVQLFTGTNLPLSAYLNADIPSDFSAAPFPRLDNVAPGRALPPSSIVAGPSLSWAAWAAANPNMKIVMVRTIVTPARGTPLIQDAVIPAVITTGARLAPVVPPAGFVPANYQVWLGAQDDLGRRFYSKYTSAP